MNNRLLAIIYRQVCRTVGFELTHSLLMYMELLVKPEILTFGNAESRLFLFAAQCFNIESMQKVILCHSCVQTLCQLPRLP
jgi:hypothetical protein